MIRKYLKLIYKLIPFKKYLFFLLKKIYVPSQNIYQHFSFKGIFKFSSGNTKFYLYHTGTLIENQLFWRGFDGYEPNSFKIWEKLCKTSKVILDLGANSGIYSLVAKSVNPSSKIHAFEPVDRVFKILKKNVSKNDFDITCHKKAVSNKDGIAFFYDDNEEFTQSVVVNMDLSETAIDRKVEEKTLHRVETETITLDTFIKENDITKIDLIKIDVETHEPEVFEGFKDNLEKFKPTLIVEIIRDHVALSLQETLSVLGYNFFYINEPFAGEDIEVEGFAYQKVDSLIGCQHGNYLICTNAIKEKLNLS